MVDLTLVMISDTHGRHNKVQVPEGDVLIHCGDACPGRGPIWEFRKFVKWFGSHPHKHKIMIAGNHDGCLISDMDLCHEELKKYPEITYLEDTGIEIEGVKFWGSPWTPQFGNWYFMVTRGEQARKKWDQIPSDTDVLITHGPPYGVLDLVHPHPTYNPGMNAGCRDLLDAVYNRVEPQIHVFGHIHGSYGQIWLPRTILWPNTVMNPGSQEKVVGGILFVNASTCTEMYEPVNPPVVLKVGKKNHGE